MIRGEEVSVVVYLTALVDALDKRIDRRLIDQEHALTLAYEAIELRLEHLNEMRGAMQDQARTYIPRAEYKIEHQALTDKLDGIMRAVARDEATNQGHKSAIGLVGSSTNTIFIAIVALVSVISMIISLFHKW